MAKIKGMTGSDFATWMSKQWSRIITKRGPDLFGPTAMQNQDEIEDLVLAMVDAEAVSPEVVMEWEYEHVISKLTPAQLARYVPMFTAAMVAAGVDCYKCRPDRFAWQVAIAQRFVLQMQQSPELVAQAGLYFVNPA